MRDSPGIWLKDQPGIDLAQSRTQGRETLLTDTASSGNQPFDLFGTKLIGITPDNGHKLIITITFIIVVIVLNWSLRAIVTLARRVQLSERIVFWIRQGISLFLAIFTLIGVLSIWFNNPAKLATFMGLVTAGFAFALQKPISAIAGYLVILRGKTFSVGDRITMSGVRGDVIALGFTQTTIMEMGQPPEVQNADPAMWIHARQYTGRIVTVSNSTVFDEPVYNYTREFPYIFEEMRVPIAYKDDRYQAEAILLNAASSHTIESRELSGDAFAELTRRYFASREDLTPKVYWRLTDNWIEMSVRFIVPVHGIRQLKDAMSRQIIDAFDKAGIGIASSTYDIVGMPQVRVQLDQVAPGEGKGSEKPD